MMKTNYSPKRATLMCLVVLNSLCFGLKAQTTEARIIDSETREPVVYATIVNSKGSGMLTNEEGRFEFFTQLKNDSLRISCLGYESRVLAVHNFSDSLVLLQPKPIALDPVFLSNKTLTASQIIEKLKEKLPKNHPQGLLQSRKLFYRQSWFQSLKKLDLKLKKTSLKAITQAKINALLATVPKKTEYHTETLSLFHEGGAGKDDKLEVIKALILEDKKQQATFEGIQDSVLAFVTKNAKSRSYYKMKSGIIPLGESPEIDSLAKNSKELDEEQKKHDSKNSLAWRKKGLHSILKASPVAFDTPVDILNKTGRYDFAVNGYTSIGDALCYIVSFAPKRKEDFKGKLFINVDDFGLLKAEVWSAQRVFDKKFNLFGVHYNKLNYKSVLIFSRGNSGSYELKYVRREMTDAFAVDRPLQIIEKNKHTKGRRRQNKLKLDLNMEMNILEREELLVYQTENLGAAAFDALKEKEEIDIDYRSAYDATYWQPHAVIAPNKAIRDFTAVNNLE